MTETELQRLLEAVSAGSIEAGTAATQILAALRAAPFDDLGFARVDHHRHLRQGFPEVVLGLGKTPAQIAAIAERIVSAGHSLLVTRTARARSRAAMASSSSRAQGHLIYQSPKRLW
jgi:pyridinium-3,5-biscarboxylic acid mononucleotide synthase